VLARLPGTYRQFVGLVSIGEVEGVTAAKELIRLLLVGQEAVARTARRALLPAAAANDQPGCDLRTQRPAVHEKNAWMLRSLLEG
jgi:starvation-inducible DNA-binding protein